MILNIAQRPIINNDANQDQWITTNMLQDFSDKSSAITCLLHFKECYFINFRRNTNNVG